MVTGHLREQNGYFQMILTWKDASGKRRSKSISTGLTVKGNKKRAEKMLMKGNPKGFPPESEHQGSAFLRFCCWSDSKRGTHQQTFCGYSDAGGGSRRSGHRRFFPLGCWDYKPVLLAPCNAGRFRPVFSERLQTVLG
jgi:hypothetical protein